MSKYIRTKDGIIYVGDLIKDEYGNYCDTKNYETDMEVPKEYIIKEADTIEELCDEFVIIYKDEYKYFANCDKPFITNVKPYSLQKDTEEKLKYFDYYGAVWTSKGLIYAAKMNDKGELELL